MTGVELYLTVLCIGTLITTAATWMHSYQMRTAALRDMATVNNLIRDLIELDRARSQRVNTLHDLVSGHNKAIEDDRAAMHMIAKRLHDQDKKLNALMLFITKQGPWSGGKQ